MFDLAALPDVPERRLAIRVTPDAIRQIRGGHPWLYDKAITSVSDPQAESGTLAVVFDADRKFVAIGLWDPASPIRVRLLHAGKPQTVDAAFWMDRLRGAHERRADLANEGTNAWRWVNGENDGFGGLIIDRYAETVVMKVYTSAWLPHLRSVLGGIVDIEATKWVVLRLGRLASRDSRVSALELRDGMSLIGESVVEEVEFTENGLRFSADVVKGQKTGHFLDQRDNRQFIRSHAAGKRVLDVFSCTGGFTVHAAAGGASSVHSVDLSPHAIDAVRSNLGRNDLLAVPNQGTVGDAFEVMASLAARGERYDLVIVDPPSFASRASERDGAIRAYRKLVDLAVTLLEPGGRLFQASCSSRVTEADLVATVHAGVRAHGRELSHEEVFGHAVDHPISFPQGRYLKAITGLVS